MRRFSEDRDGERLFYLCPKCGTRRTYLTTINAWSEDWPVEVFDQAVQCGVIAKNGRPI
jgi:DNA-directed RNA polymerase subunit M/transcription elongation factor TFIIS